MSTVSIIGLGKLGASMAAAIASRGMNVIGVDVNHSVVDLLNQGHAPVQEMGLEEMIAANKSRLRATLDHGDAILNSDLSFVIVPTPSDERGAFSLQYATWAFREIGRALRNKPDYHLVVLTSTVLPGSTRYGLLPILEMESGKSAGCDFGLCYSPEFIALGSVIRDFLNPDFTLVGELDARSGDALAACYGTIMANHPPCRRMSLENAELTKIAVNTYITTKITFANMLADLCQRIPGGDVDVVTEALGSDTRIGRKYLTGALGYGGPCFPRDNVALGFLARALGTRAELAETTDASNRGLAEKILVLLRGVIKHDVTVAVLGLAYKPRSHVIEESQGIYLARALSEAGARVVAFDPLANRGAHDVLRDHAVLLESAHECLQQADVVLITTPDPVFRQLAAADFPVRSTPVTVVDFWRILAGPLAGASHLRYMPFGRSTRDAENAASLINLWDSAMAPAKGGG